MSPFENLAKLRQSKVLQVAGETVRLRQMTSLERDDYHAWVAKNSEAGGWKGVSRYLLLLTLETTDGTAATADQIDAFPGWLVELLARESMELNMLSSEAMETAKKNLIAVPACGG